MIEGAGWHDLNNPSALIIRVHFNGLFVLIQRFPTLQSHIDTAPVVSVAKPMRL